MQLQEIPKSLIFQIVAGIAAVALPLAFKSVRRKARSAFERIRPLIINPISFGLLIGTLVAILFNAGFLEEYEVKTLDSRFRSRAGRNFDSRLVLILITDECFDLYGPFPWPRSKFAKALDILTDAGAGAVGFDFVFAEENPLAADEDKALVDAAAKSRRAFFPLVFKEITEMGEDTSQLVKKTRLFKPFAALSEAARGLGFIDIKFKDINPDGVIRRIVVTRPSEEVGLAKCLGLEIAANVMEAQVTEKDGVTWVGKRKLPLYNFDIDGEQVGTYHINFQAGDSFEAIPFHYLTEGMFSADELAILKDKIVLIGTSATSLPDFYFTPFGLRPGVEIHANVIRNVLENDMLERQSRLSATLTILAASLLAAWLTGKFFFFVNSPILLLLAMLYGGAAQLLFNYANFIVEVIPILLTVVSIYVVNNFFMMIERLRISRDNLAKKVIELQGLHNIGQLITSTFTVDTFFAELVKTLKQMFRVKKCSILLYNALENTLTMRAAVGFGADEEISTEKRVLNEKGSVSRYVIDNRKAVLVTDMRNDPRFPGAKGSRYKSASFISAPIIHADQVIGIINLTDREEGTEFTGDDLAFIDTFANQASIGVEKMEFLNRMVEQERLEQELKVGTQMQMSLLPTTTPERDDMEIFAKLIPAKEIGGDLYYFVNFDEHHAGFIVGDVAGKGVQAGLFMAMSSVMIKSFKSCSPGAILKHTNKSLVEYFEESTPSYLTAIYAVIDTSDMTATLGKAGHEPPILIRAATGEITYLEDISGLPLGMFYFPDSEYEEMKVPLSSGDILILYTDGFPEATNAEGDILGREEFLDLVKTAPLANLNEMGDFLFEKALEFEAGASRSDDMTMVIIRIK